MADPELDVEESAAEEEDEEEAAEQSARYWQPSAVTSDYLQDLEDGCFIPPKTESAWQVPGDETVPAP